MLLILLYKQIRKHRFEWHSECGISAASANLLAASNRVSGLGKAKVAKFKWLLKVELI